MEERWLLAEQDAQAVDRLDQTAFQEGNPRFGVGQVRLCLGDVQLGCDPRLEPALNELESLTLSLDIRPGVSQSGLERTYFHVVQCDLGVEAHEQIAVLFDRGIQIGLGRLDPATEPPEHVDLPRSVKADRRQVGLVGTDGAGWDGNQAKCRIGNGCGYAGGPGDGRPRISPGDAAGKLLALGRLIGRNLKTIRAGAGAVIGRIAGDGGVHRSGGDPAQGPCFSNARTASLICQLSVEACSTKSLSTGSLKTIHQVCRQASPWVSPLVTASCQASGVGVSGVL